MTDVREDPSEEAHAVTRRLFQVVERAKEDFAAVAHDVGLTPLQARTLLTLREPVPMRELADRMDCDASNITGLADRLERLGAVARVPAPKDRRIKMLELTPGGQELRNRLADKVGEGSTVMATLNRQERKQLANLLDKLLAT
jgi:DNA-binding MarR family transcriptional regulator